MKKILIVLIVLVTKTFQLSSQTPSNDSTCCVPCEALRSALILKSNYNLLKSEILVTRDSVSILQKQNLVKDSIMSDHKSINSVKDTIINLNKSIILEREKQVTNLNKNITVLKTQRNLTIIGSIAIIALKVLLFK